MNIDGGHLSVKCPYLISFLTEFAGTAILMWIGCMGCLELFNIGPVIPAFAFGMAFCMAVQSFNHISVIHVNPAISVGELILGKITILRCLVYVPAQYTGALFGYMFLVAVVPWKETELCLLHLDNYTDVLNGFFIEFGAAVVLMMVACGASHERNESFKDSLPLRLGMIYTGLILAVWPFTGAGLNPARGLAPALFNNTWKHAWMYQVSPFAGMSLAAVVYRFVLDSSEKYSLHTFFLRRCRRWCLPP